MYLGMLFGNTAVAIKSMERPSPREQEDFAREIIFLKACRHPHIIQVRLSYLPLHPLGIPAVCSFRTHGPTLDSRAEVPPTSFKQAFRSSNGRNPSLACCAGLCALLTGL